MGKLIDGFQIDGTVGNLSFYRMKGVDKPIVRTPGGPSRNKVLKSKSFELTRKNASEFTRCVFASSGIRDALRHVRHLADYNFTPVLSSLCKKVQLLDGINDRGKRVVLLSQHPYFFNGFSLNRKNSFDSMVRSPVTHTIDKVASTATVELPSLLPGVNLLLPWPVPQYRMIISLALAPDQVITANGRKTKTDIRDINANTEWLASNQPFAGQIFTLQHDLSSIAGYALVLAIGIEMEIPQLKGWGGVQRIGAAKILEMK